MSAELVLAIVGAAIMTITFAVIIIKKMPKRVKSSHYVKKWREIQKLCGDKNEWKHAIVHADMLLDDALKKRRAPGKTMGERMVSVQKKFKSNDSIWKAHKLAGTIKQDKVMQLTEAEVKESLVAFRQSLRDLGAL